MIGLPFRCVRAYKDASSVIYQIDFVTGILQVQNQMLWSVIIRELDCLLNRRRFDDDAFRNR